MCSGPTIQSGGNRQSNLPGIDALASFGISRRGGRPPANTGSTGPVDLAPQRQQLQNWEQYGGNILRGLQLPSVTPTGPADLRNLTNLTIRR